MDCLEKRIYKMSAYDNKSKQNKEVVVTIICEDSFDGHFNAIDKVSKDHPEWTNITEIENRLIDYI